MSSIVNKSQKQIVIVGAGLAGLAAARLLTQEGHSPIVLDKGRRIGGRCGTRVSSEGGFLFNHGAQFVTATGSSNGATFAALCREAERAGVLSLVSNSSSGSNTNGNEVYAVKASAALDLPSWMAEGIDVRQNVDIKRIFKQENGQLRLRTASDNQEINGNDGSDSDSDSARDHFVADRLIVTAPAPQTAQLLQEAAPALAARALTARYDPCWEVLAGYEKHGDGGYSDVMPTCDIPQDGTTTTTSSSSSNIIGWYKHSYRGNGHGTGNGSAGAALTIQATAGWSQANLEASNSTVATQIYDVYTQLAGSSSSSSNAATTVQAVPALLRAHRWRYARVAVPAPSDHSIDVAIFTAGDWCQEMGETAGEKGVGVRVSAGEGGGGELSRLGLLAQEAFLSGEAAARALLLSL